MPEIEAEHQARVGKIIGGKYRVLRLLGAGGMGAVYEAENSWIKRRVAIKVLRSELARNEDVVQRFTQEAQSATQIEHPNIVYVLDMGQDPTDGALYIVQEFLTGGDLRQQLEKQPRLSIPEALAILVPVMGALVVAHERGIVHRDIKPENIFVARGPNGETIPKLIDFGISKMMSTEGAHTKTRTGLSLGTPYYMSPEQARGDSNVDARTDVWAMGIVLFELLAGAPPFDAPNYNLLILRILTERPGRIDARVPEVPREFADVIERALEPDREKRFATMRAFLTALMAYADSRDDFQLAAPVTTMSLNSQLATSTPNAMAPLPAAAGKPTAPGGLIGGTPVVSPAPLATAPPGLQATAIPAALNAPPGFGSAGPYATPMMDPAGAAAMPTGGQPSGIGPAGAPPNYQTALGWTQGAAPPQRSYAARLVAFGVTGLALMTGTGLWVRNQRHRHHHHAADAVMTSDARLALAPTPSPATQAALEPQPVVQVEVPSENEHEISDRRAAPRATRSTHVPIAPTPAAANGAPAQGALSPVVATPTPSNSGAHEASPSGAAGSSPTGAATPSTDSPSAPQPRSGSANAPATAAPVPSHATPAPTRSPQPAPAAADPVTQQGLALSQRLQTQAAEMAASEPRRSNRMYVQSARIQQQANEIRSLETQARGLQASDPQAAGDLRDRASRLRDRLQRMIDRAEQDAER